MSSDPLRIAWSTCGPALNELVTGVALAAARRVPKNPAASAIKPGAWVIFGK
jgi:hypothetical protein